MCALSTAVVRIVRNHLTYLPITAPYDPPPPLPRIQSSSGMLNNNKVERHIRSIAMGRKVWFFSTSERGARACASWYSLVEIAKANDLEPYWYMRTLFEEIPSRLRDEKPLDALFP